MQRERAATDTTLVWVRWLWLGAAVLLAASAMAAALYFGRALRNPLQQLSEGARALQSGQLGHRIPLAGQDEFAEVAHSVNALAAELEQHRERESAQRHRLEVQVAERTRDLADAATGVQQGLDRLARLQGRADHRAAQTVGVERAGQQRIDRDIA